MKYLQLSEAQVNEFCVWLGAYLPSEITREGSRRESVDKMLASLDELASPEVCAKRTEYFGLTDTEPFRERVLSAEGNRVVIAGLRYKKLNREFPFVQLCTNFLVRPQELSSLKQKVAASFAPMNLKGFTFRHPTDLFAEVAHEKWSQILFGKTTDLENHELPEGMRAQWGKEVDFYEEYEREFKNFLDENPEKKAYLWIEEKEDLERAAADGLLMSVWDEKGWAGVIAAKPKDLYGLPCAYIFEIFLAKRVRGQKAGRLMQAQFLAGISSRLPYVFGHINHSNLSSLKTALALGRRAIETEYFFPFL